jgi:hypothetical protein
VQANSLQGDQGIRYDLHVDPKSGEITKSERDDD